MNTPNAQPFGIGELAERAGISRRAVRYYVQEGLLPPPYGRGRGSHYGAEHLERVLQIKTLQESGASLDEIRQRLSGAPVAELPALERWWRLPVAPGLELHLTARPGLDPERLARFVSTVRDAWDRLGNDHG